MDVRSCWAAGFQTGQAGRNGEVLELKVSRGIPVSALAELADNFGELSK